ncbi:Maf family protein [Paracidobacterium acidisoli]|uniref:dTTP/UTP pyrophosphatase n=1 Tax=Paracidobacterium acidisoli TaxID=2303751 RepID=A0A372INJ1_9BACT|nr:Maf family protein [Paracidobacterium acidisoli]MBT9331789.1 septum formation inhibitor Maf [Paracidobacterium acidisoli]
MLVLASASPRRRELLAQIGLNFRVLPSSIPEDVRSGESPVAYVTRVAREKARAVYTAQSEGDAEEDALLVLGADTAVVAPNGEILGKPADEADAARMLRLLSGATHEVVTGVCLLSDVAEEIAAEVTYVTVNTLSDAEIAAYIATGEPNDKAGAYGIQGYAARWIPRIHGCYFNVMGLPLALVVNMLEGMQARMGLQRRLVAR